MRLTSLLIALVLLIVAIPTGAQNPSFKVSTTEEIKADFSAVPCEDKKRLDAVKSLFERAGVLPCAAAQTIAGGGAGRVACRRRSSPVDG
jgi:hypothetical protein